MRPRSSAKGLPSLWEKDLSRPAVDDFIQEDLDVIGKNGILSALDDAIRDLAWNL